MTTTDHESILCRLPPDVRAMAERDGQVAFDREWSAAPGDMPVWVIGERQHEARLAALAPYKAAADEADAVAQAARDRWNAHGDARSALVASAVAEARAAFWERWRREGGREARGEQGACACDLRVGMHTKGAEGCQHEKIDLLAEHLAADLAESNAGAHMQALRDYLADKPAETLQVIAALVKALPGLHRPRLHGFDEPWFALVANLPGAKVATVPRFKLADDAAPPPGAHICASVEVDGLLIEAMFTTGGDS